MLKETPEDHPDRSVSQETFSKFQELADFVNTSLKESESRKKMNDLRKNITGLKNLESPNRSLIKEGPVSLNTPKKKYQVCFVFFPLSFFILFYFLFLFLFLFLFKLFFLNFFFPTSKKCLLFNDLLVFATGSETKVNAVVLVLQLDSLWYEDLEDLDPQTVREDAVEVYTPERPYTIYTGNNNEKKLWLAALKKAISANVGGDDVGKRDLFSFFLFFFSPSFSP